MAMKLYIEKVPVESYYFIVGPGKYLKTYKEITAWNESRPCVSEQLLAILLGWANPIEL